MKIIHDKSEKNEVHLPVEPIWNHLQQIRGRSAEGNEERREAGDTNKKSQKVRGSQPTVA